MVATQLTDRLVEDGVALVLALDASAIKPRSAFWFLFSDVGSWKLVIADPKLGPDGPRGAYKQIQKVLKKLQKKSNSLVLEDVVLAKPDAPIVEVMRTALRTGPGISGIRFTGNMINGVLIDDAYIYRLS